MPLSATDQAAIEALARALEQDGDVLFITGAGLSADSGLPTYRGVGGLYEGQATPSGMSIEEALSLPVFLRRPDLTWRHLRNVIQAGQGARPNRGHQVIAALSRRLPRVVVLTQNIDGLHTLAGSSDVIEIHGHARQLECGGCGRVTPAPNWEALPAVPRCPVCTTVLRPPVVLFGEALPSAAVERLERELRRGFAVVVSVGTSSRFPYIAAPVQLVQQAGGLAAELNPGTTPVSPLVDLRIRGGAAEALGRLGQHLGLG